MIVLHEPKLIFLKSGKVAGTSFEIALSKFADADSIITPVTENDEKIRRQFGFRGPQNFRAGLADVMAMPRAEVARALLKRRWPSKFDNHMSPKEARQVLGDDVWQAYEKIAIVRDPFDYAISCYFWQNKKEARPDFDAWCMENTSLFTEKSDQYLIDGREIIDFYIRYDQFEEDVLDLERRHPSLKGLWECFSAIKAKSGYRPKEATTEEMFSAAPNARSLISKICHDEIRKFDFHEPRP